MSISAVFLLAIVAAVLTVLIVIDVARHRRLTPAVRARLIVVIIFVLVIVWLLQHKAPLPA